MVKINDTISLVNGDIVKVLSISNDIATCKSLYVNMQDRTYKVKTDLSSFEF